ncbi:hypothetical protein ACRAWD_14075 [Caulobacter segnis]
MLGPPSPLEKAHSTSLVALDVMTGKRRMPVDSRAVHNGSSGTTTPASQATLVNFPTPTGTRLRPWCCSGKQGDLYVLDRRTGAPLTGVVERPVPQGGVEREQRAPTQPHSLYHTLRKPDLTAAKMWGMSPIDQMICRIQFRRATCKGFAGTPPETKGRKQMSVYPGYNGGSDWGRDRRRPGARAA